MRSSHAKDLICRLLTSSLLSCGQGADADRAGKEIEEVLGLDVSGAILASAKQRIGEHAFAGSP